MTSPVLMAPDAVAAQVDDPVAPTLVDVRAPAEYETAHVPGSVNVPLPLVHEHAETLAAALDDPVVLVCQAGNRARTAVGTQYAAAAGAGHSSARSAWSPAASSPEASWPPSASPRPASRPAASAQVSPWLR
ncbi:Rhodanese-related sulfurtransferase [Modestobacter sp. DSM 44400]|uniref:rhodanese-like domain-containing protein n=1 Tax=Modestobacter sp. DSM 44400 TaxID=1550230 RepID=UPI0008955241|nr:rhodanese-like domain-containing protein [Modestobacter sp. DSM 44400]SDX53381.1 Rhodanese-related sulfurtransferase [Modestobacter sp. DSM 44400]